MGTSITITTANDSVTITGDDVRNGPTYDKLEGWYGTPSVDLGFVKRPNAPGAFAPVQTYPDEAVISIEGDMFAADRSAGLVWRERLAGLYNDGKAVTVTVADDLRTTSRECMVEAVNFPWTIHQEFEFSIDMKAADSRRYGVAATVGTVLAAPGSGLQLPYDEPTGVGLELPSDETPTPDLGLDLGTIGVDGRVTVTNDGNTATTSSYTVSGGSMPDGFVLVNVTTGERLTYIGEVVDGATYTLDTRLRAAFINGSGPAGRWLASPEWWSIPPKSSVQIAFLARGPVTGTPRVDITTAPAFY